MCTPQKHQGVASDASPPLQAETEQLKRQIEELSGRIGELMAEKDTLQNRNSLLEKVVQVRSASDKSAQSQVRCIVLRAGTSIKHHQQLHLSCTVDTSACILGNRLVFPHASPQVHTLNSRELI